MPKHEDKKDEDLAELLSLRELKRGQRVVGARLTKVSEAAAKEYEAGASIRQLAELTDRSYGWVQRTLVSAGVELRSRGGANRKRLSHDRSMDG